MKSMFAWIILLLVLLSACTQAQTQPERSTPTTGGPAQTEEGEAEPSKGGEGTAAPADQSGNNASDVIVMYQRSGGLRGLTETWTLYADGRFVAANGQENQVSEPAVQDLLKSIEAAGFFEMQGNYGLMSQCNDCYEYEVTVVQNGQKHTVKTVDGAPGVPDALWQIMDQISNLVVGS